MTKSPEDETLLQLVNRGILIFSIVWFLALGSGALGHLHNAQHAREDAACESHGHDSDVPPVHDDTNCSVHAQLNAPIVAPPAVVLLICAGLLVAFVSELASPLVSLRIPARNDCRGPPVLE